MKTSLYRYYSKGNQLLYVGISHHPFLRMCQHGYSGKRIEEVFHVELEWFDIREDALKAETLAIRREKPLWNVARPRDRVLAKTAFEKNNKLTLVNGSKFGKSDPNVSFSGYGPPAPWMEYALGSPRGNFDYRLPSSEWSKVCWILRRGDILTVERDYVISDKIQEAATSNGFYIVRDAA